MMKRPRSLCALRARLSDTGGLSVVETVCIIGISAFGVLLAIWLGFYLMGFMQRGDDANAVNTATGLGEVGRDAACLVNSCTGASDPEHAFHFTEDGFNRAYLDRTTNTLVGDAPHGYNESADPEIDGEAFVGDAGTLVIQVTLQDDQIVCTWVPGS